MYYTIGKKIKGLRTLEKLSQTSFIEGICSTAYLSKIENDKVTPSQEFCEQISAKYNIHLDFFSSKPSNDYLLFLKQNLNKLKGQSPDLSNIQNLKYAFLHIIPSELSIELFIYLLKYYIETNQFKSAEDIYQNFYKSIPICIEDYLYSNPDLYFNYYIILGNFLYLKEDYSQADTYFTEIEQSISFFTELDQAKLYYNISLTKQRVVYNKKVALSYSKKALEIFHSNHLHLNYAQTLITIGIQLKLDKNYLEAKEYLLKAKEFILKQSFVEREQLLLMVTFHSGRIFHEEQNFSQAIESYEYCLTYFKSEKEKIFVLKAYLEVDIEKKDWFQAEKHLREIRELANEQRLVYIKIECIKYQSKIYLAVNDLANYEIELKEAINAALTNGYSVLAFEFSKELAEYYHEQNFYKKASYYYNLALSYI